MIYQQNPLVVTGLLTGKMGIIVTMFLTSLLILMFGFMAIRLRKGVLSAMGEVASNLIRRFTAPSGGGSMSSSMSASTGGGGGGGAGSGGFSNTVGTAVNSTVNGVGSTLGRNLALTGVGAAGVGVVGSKMFGGKSDEHESVATGDGESFAATSLQNAQAGNVNESAQISQNGDVSSVQANAETLTDGSATNGEFMNSQMMASAMSDKSEKAMGMSLMDSESLASVSQSNGSTTSDNKSVQAGQSDLTSGMMYDDTIANVRGVSDGQQNMAFDRYGVDTGMTNMSTGQGDIRSVHTQDESQMEFGAGVSGSTFDGNMSSDTMSNRNVNFGEMLGADGMTGVSDADIRGVQGIGQNQSDMMSANHGLNGQNGVSQNANSGIRGVQGVGQNQSAIMGANHGLNGQNGASQGANSGIRGVQGVGQNQSDMLGANHGLNGQNGASQGANSGIRGVQGVGQNQSDMMGANHGLNGQNGASRGSSIGMRGVQLSVDGRSNTGFSASSEGSASGSYGLGRQGVMNNSVSSGGSVSQQHGDGGRQVRSVGAMGQRNSFAMSRTNESASVHSGLQSGGSRSRGSGSVSGGNSTVNQYHSYTGASSSSVRNGGSGQSPLRNPYQSPMGNRDRENEDGSLPVTPQVPMSPEPMGDGSRRVGSVNGLGNGSGRGMSGPAGSFGLGRGDVHGSYRNTAGSDNLI